MELHPSLPPHFDLKPIDKNANKLAVLRKLLKRKDVTELINACDAGREGELISAISFAQPGQAALATTLAAIDDPTVDPGRFHHLRSDQDLMPLADAAVSRSEADWLIGINATRSLTKVNSQHGGFQKTTAAGYRRPRWPFSSSARSGFAVSSQNLFRSLADFGVSAGTYRGRWFDPAFKKNGEDDARAERIWERAKAEAIVAKCAGKPGTIEEERSRLRRPHRSFTT
jgi:DNA topoisomerase-3